MPGRGFAPKPSARRVGHSKDRMAQTVLPLSRGKQPGLPKVMPMGLPWPAQTRAWWKRWGASPLSGSFTDLDWSELLDTAILHGRLWALGDVKAMPELRLRVAKFGATPEDRARLRITFAEADEKDARRPVPAENRWAGLKVVE